MELRLKRRAFDFALRLRSADDDHPIHGQIKRAQRRVTKRHPSQLARLLHSFPLLHDAQVERIRTLPLSPWELHDSPRVVKAKSREESIAQHATLLGARHASGRVLHVYTDGSRLDSGHTGASWVVRQQHSRTNVEWTGGNVALGTLRTVYEAEVFAIGKGFQALLADGLIDEETEEVHFWVDNQAALDHALLPHRGPAQEFAIAARRAYLAFRAQHHCISVTMHWIAGHEDVEGNERADEAAKAAAQHGERACCEDAEEDEQAEDEEDEGAELDLADAAIDDLLDQDDHLFDWDDLTLQEEPPGLLDTSRPHGAEEGAGHQSSSWAIASSSSVRNPGCVSSTYSAGADTADDVAKDPVPRPSAPKGGPPVAAAHARRRRRKQVLLPGEQLLLWDGDGPLPVGASCAELRVLHRRAIAEERARLWASHPTGKAWREADPSPPGGRQRLEQLACLPRRLVSILTQLRSGCSPLNGDRYRRKLHETPACACGALWESRRHYLLECPLYTTQRRALKRSLKCKTLRISHLGDLRATLAVANYINATDRFPTYFARISEEMEDALTTKGPSPSRPRPS